MFAKLSLFDVIVESKWAGDAIKNLKYAFGKVKSHQNTHNQVLLYLIIHTSINAPTMICLDKKNRGSEFFGVNISLLKEYFCSR